jgi:hypothetical protein
MPDRGEWKYARSRSDRGDAGEADMRNQPNAVAKHDIGSDVAERTNDDVFAKARAWFDARAAVDRRRA